MRMRRGRKEMDMGKTTWERKRQKRMGRDRGRRERQKGKRRGRACKGWPWK
jgi:hypothetical protein